MHVCTQHTNTIYLDHPACTTRACLLPNPCICSTHLGPWGPLTVPDSSLAIVLATIQAIELVACNAVCMPATGIQHVHRVGVHNAVDVGRPTVHVCSLPAKGMSCVEAYQVVLNLQLWSTLAGTCLLLQHARMYAEGWGAAEEG